MSSFSLKLFEKRLAETIAWCVPRLNPDDLENCFRSPPMPEKWEHKHAGYTIEEIAPFAVIVEQKRREAVGTPDIYTSPVNMAGGRLMISSLSTTTCDGIAPYDTNGYVDECDVAAWDTWVYWARDYRGSREKYHYHDYVIAWVPQILHKGVQVATEMSALESLGWIEDCELYNFSFCDTLKQAGYFVKPQD